MKPYVSFIERFGRDWSDHFAALSADLTAHKDRCKAEIARIDGVLGNKEWSDVEGR